jgi:hypothetical protein
MCQVILKIHSDSNKAYFSKSCFRHLQKYQLFKFKVINIMSCNLKPNELKFLQNTLFTFFCIVNY